MTTITLEPLFHRNEQQIAVKFHYNQKVKAHLRKLDLISWTQTHKTFYLKRSLQNIKQLILYLREAKLNVDYSAIAFLEIHEKEKTISISSSNRRRMDTYTLYLVGKRYSKSTIATYGNFALLFLQYLRRIKCKSIDQKVFRAFIEQMVITKNYSISTHRQLVSALKHFCDCFGLEQIDQDMLQRPKKSSYLPMVLSKKEIVDLLRNTKNLKHRAILVLIYSAGLRIGELINLELRDIDIDRRQIIVKNGKGRKDRYVVLAESFLPLLANYFTTYRPYKYFAEGQANKKYSPESIRCFLKRSCRAAGISKRVTPHTLRHSYATHLLENGIGLRHIQELLGHAKPETTMIYTHVAKKDLLRVESPLDELIKSLADTDKNKQKVLLSGNI